MSTNLTRLESFPVAGGPTPCRSTEIIFDSSVSELSQSSDLRSILANVGLSVDDFYSIIHEQTTPERPPIDEIIPMGNTYEYVTVGIIKLGEETIEISHARRDAPQITPMDIEMQLHQGNRQSYKLLVGIRGHAELQCVEVEPMGQIYGAHHEGDSYRVARGDIVVVPAGTGWYFTYGSSDLEYLYISFPPHSSNGDLFVDQI